MNFLRESEAGHGVRKNTVIEMTASIKRQDLTRLTLTKVSEKNRDTAKRIR